MILLFKLVALTVIIVLALRVALSEGMLLEKLGAYFERKVDEGHKYFELFICPWCMGSLQSVTSHFFAFGLGILPFEFNWQLLIRGILVIFASSFISGLLWTVYLTLNQIKENNQAQAEYYQFINRRD